MGGGSWTSANYLEYSASKGRTVTADGFSTTQNMFVAKKIHDDLDPYKKIRECCDSEEHPNTVPVILALDVTGSMGQACMRTASALSHIMQELYTNHTDIEFMIMGIGDLAYDHAPIQASQFESDVRIAEAVDHIYMEGGGGGNAFESYTAAWYFGLKHTKLDCWKRGRKGIIITLGDEPLNPYLSKSKLSKVLGDTLQADVETDGLYKECCEKFHIYHIAVDDSDTMFYRYKSRIEESWGKLLGQNYQVSTIDSLPKVITDCIDNAILLENASPITGETVTQEEVEKADNGEVKVNPDTGAISW